MNGTPPADLHSPDAGAAGFLSGEAIHEDATRLLESLRQASADASLDDETRQLMKQALELLRVTTTQKDCALLRYRALFDAVPDPVSILAEFGTVLDLNKAGMAAYKRQRE